MNNKEFIDGLIAKYQRGAKIVSRMKQMKCNVTAEDEYGALFLKFL